MSDDYRQSYLNSLTAAIKDDIDEAAELLIEEAKEEFASKLRQELIKHTDIMLTAMTNFERIGTDLVITIKDPVKLTKDT